MIKIYTDGSCIGNPGNGGWAAIIIENLEVINIQVEKETKQCSLSSAEGVLDLL